MCFCLKDTATTEIYTYLHTLSLHDALPILLTQSYEQARRSYAGYADGTFDLSAALAVYGGLRYTWDKGRLTNFQVAPIIPVQADKSYSDGEPTGRTGVRLKPSEDIMLYGQFARGYRSSAINGGALTNPADLNVANPEKLDSWEVGVTSQLFDRIMTFNAPTFLYTFPNQPNHE